MGKTKFDYILCKSAITRSKLPDADYVVNPYIGCSFACSYCYASFMGRFVGKSYEQWGDFLFVKKEYVKYFEKEIQKLNTQIFPPSILLSSVTDPYQPIEKKLNITRNILLILKNKQYSGRVSILTKSPLILRDLDILKELPNLDVGITITPMDNHIMKHLEKQAPSIKSRWKTVANLLKEGILPHVFIGPLLPHLLLEKKYFSKIETMFKKISLLGIEEVFVEYLNISAHTRKNILQTLEKGSDDYVFYKEYKNKHNGKYDDIIKSILDKYQLKLRTSTIINHTRR